MRAFLRLWTMCLWLTATSPVYWGMTLAALYGAWRWRLPQWGWLWVSTGAAAGSLMISVFVEAGGAVYDRIRFAQSKRVALGAAAAAIATFALGWWAVSFILLARLL